MAARKRIWTPNVVRDRIRVSMLRHRLENHVLGRIEMSPTQVRAAEILLKKTLPDLQAIEHSGVIEQPMTREQIIERLTGIHSGAAGSDATGSAAGSNGADRAAPTTH